MNINISEAVPDLGCFGELVRVLPPSLSVCVVSLVP